MFLCTKNDLRIYRPGVLLGRSWWLFNITSIFWNCKKCYLSSSKWLL